MFNLIQRVPEIDVDSPLGSKPASVTGVIQMRNVAFSYPSRKKQPVFTNLSLDIAAGQTVALVGSSGSGKSTVVQLILRFYDPGTDLGLSWYSSSPALRTDVARGRPILYASSCWKVYASQGVDMLLGVCSCQCVLAWWKVFAH